MAFLPHDCVREVENAYSQEGGLTILYDDLAPKGAVVKSAGVRPEMLPHSGPAVIFESETDAYVGIVGGKVKAGAVVVIRYEGPRGGPGMAGAMLELAARIHRTRAEERSTMNRHLTAALAVLLTFVTGRVPAAIFYVAPNGNGAWSGTLSQPNATVSDGPFATVVRARDAVRSLKTRGPVKEPVTVFLREGVYRVPSAIEFTPDDSGTETTPITYAAMKGEHPVISGGRPITGWQKGEGQIWKVAVPGVKDRQWYFHQPFVNGQRRTRARTPNRGYLYTEGVLAPFDRAKRYIEYLRLQGISFQHTDCYLAADMPLDERGATERLPMIAAQGLRHAVFEDCELAHAGENGLWLDSGCCDNLLRRLGIHDLGAGAVFIGPKRPQGTPETAVQRNVVDNCFLYDGSHIFRGSQGV
jgi:hypothetical protein